MKVGYFPYLPGANPYQRLFAAAIEAQGARVNRIPPRKLFPLRFAAGHDSDVLQLDWPHDWYQGRNAWTRFAKGFMYRDGLRCLRRRAVVWTAHNLQTHNTHDAALDRRSIQALIDVCDGIIVLSGASGNLLRSEYSVPDRTIVEVIHHGHYIGCYPNTISREAARERLGIPGGARVVISLGRLQPYKGLEELLEAFEAVAQSGDVLILAGRIVDSTYASRLQQAICELRRQDISVRLEDAVIPDDEIQVYFRACDVVALPFRHVLNSGSLLLAMSFGCPVVAPRLGSIPEVACPEGWFGYCPTSAGSLAGALESALRIPDLEALRKRVVDFTASRYDWSRVGQQAMALYRRVTDTPGA